MGFAVFKCRATSEEVTAALDRIMSTEQVQPQASDRVTRTRVQLRAFQGRVV